MRKLRVTAAIAEEAETRQPAGELDGIQPAFWGALWDRGRSIGARFLLHFRLD